MIISTHVDIKLNSNNFNYWTDLGYNIPAYVDTRGRNKLYKRGSFLKVKVSDLTVKSNVRVQAKCVKCGLVRSVCYSQYSEVCFSCNLTSLRGDNHPRRQKDFEYDGKDRLFFIRIKRKYNLSISDYYRILDEQNNQCGICKTLQGLEGRRFAIDHDHKSNKVRGILCQPCNTGIGLLKDCVNNLQSAVEYLRKAA